MQAHAFQWDFRRISPKQWRDVSDTKSTGQTRRSISHRWGDDTSGACHKVHCPNRSYGREWMERGREGGKRKGASNATDKQTYVSFRARCVEMEYFLKMCRETKQCNIVNQYKQNLNARQSPIQRGDMLLASQRETMTNGCLLRKLKYSDG